MTDLPTLLSRATPEQLAEALIEATEGLANIRLNEVVLGDFQLAFGEAQNEARATLSRIDAIMNPGGGALKGD